MLVKTLLLDIKRALADPGYSDEVLLRFINEAQKVIASRVLCPDLESQGVVTLLAISKKVDIPESWKYHRQLHTATVGTETIKIVSSLGLLTEYVPTFTTSLVKGTPQYLTVTGQAIWYYPSPTEDTEITCLFYKEPSLVDTLSTSLPIKNTDSLTKHWVLAEAFSEIEDGIEGAKVNESYNRIRFDELLELFELQMNMGQSYLNPIRGTDSYWI